MVDTNSIIEGTVKFRDGKKWKWRWCVMRKLSPVADCLHLQLYRDSKDRCKLGHTKASLSLQHFLGVETGFTLDKESNTIAILCQDVTVILAFDTRERLIQWQVKIANNLGEDQQFLIQISSAPPKSKIQPGPARLHVQELRFCVTSGVPPKLHGCWEIANLRRYGVVDGKFCFEGGTRCGKGEGLHVLVSDQAEDVEHAVRLAAHSKLFTRRRTVSRNMSVVDSPSRKSSQSRSGTRTFDLDTADGSCCCSEDFHDNGDDFPYACSDSHSPFWPSAESSRTDDLDSNYGCGDTASVREMSDSVSQIHGDGWMSDDRRGRIGLAMERCTSCFSKLGAPSISRSSTGATCTPATPLAPAWPSETANSYQCCHHTGTGTSLRPKTASSISDRLSLSSHGSSENSEFFVPRLSCFDSSPRGVSTCSKAPVNGCQCVNTCHCAPARPPKLSGITPAVEDQTSPSKKKRKPPMLLSDDKEQSKDKDYVVHTCSCHTQCVNHRFPLGNEAEEGSMVGPYENYDVPRPVFNQMRDETKCPDSECLLAQSTADVYYDTPKNIKQCLSKGEDNSEVCDYYANYDTLPAAKPLLNSCACMRRYAKNTAVVLQGADPKTVLDDDLARSEECPCQRVMCWPENFMRLAYCRRGSGVDNASISIQKVKLSGEGKMPVVNQHGEVELYATIDRSKKTNRRKNIKPEESEKETYRDNEPAALDPMLNYENVKIPTEIQSAAFERLASHPNYANIQFARSLEHYENSRDVLLKAGITIEEMGAIAYQRMVSCIEGKMCTKCGHCSQDAVIPDSAKSDITTVEGCDADRKMLDDYMMMEPNKSTPESSNVQASQFNGKNFPGYLPMSPITGPGQTSNETKTTTRPTAPVTNITNNNNNNNNCNRINNNNHNQSELMKMCLNRMNGSGLPSEKSVSIPSLTAPYVDRGKKRQDSAFLRIPGSAMLMANHSSASNSPYLQKVTICEDETKRFQIARRRSNSADSTRYLEDFESVSPSVFTSSRVSSVNSLPSQCECINTVEKLSFDCGKNHQDQDSNPPLPSDSGSTISTQTLVQEIPDMAASSCTSSAVHIRRSSSVPCKGNNRDSSSSNDSGVSIGSLRHRGSDFNEFELPLTTALSSTWRHQRLAMPCMHASLQRRSKSSDPLKEISFRFHKINIHAKSSSAEAEVPVCTAKKGRTSPSSDGAPPIPYMDCNSTSSGTSDMSDYIETLSLSSHSSSDNPECLRLQATTTLRPRSGKEYQKIDRSILERDTKIGVRQHMGSVPEKTECESPSTGYQSTAATP